MMQQQLLILRHFLGLAGAGAATAALAACMAIQPEDGIESAVA